MRIDQNWRPALAMLMILPGASESMRGQNTQDLPTRPYNPTKADCQRLSSQYQQIRQQLFNQKWSCMSQAPKFGHARGCSGNSELTAWVQCQDFTLQSCALERTQDGELKACFADAKIQEEQDKAAKARADRDSDTAKQMKLSNDLIEKGQQLVTLLNDPVSFFAKALNPGSIAEKKLFSDPTNPKTLNVDLAEQVYRFAQDYSKLGLSTTVNPVTRALQMAMLEQIGEVYKRIQQEANQIDSEMNGPDSLRLRGVGQPVKSSPPKASDTNCSVFDDQNASRTLMEKDGARWLELYQMCGSPK